MTDDIPALSLVANPSRDHRPNNTCNARPCLSPSSSEHNTRPLHSIANTLPNERFLSSQYNLHAFGNAREPYIRGGHEILTASEFLAISLVRQPTADIVAVALDRISSEVRLFW